MTGDPRDADPAAGDEPPADAVMLALLSNRGRSGSPLSAEQERLLDAWVAGRLPADNAQRAEALTRDNAVAAERVLERRLLEAAGRNAPVPDALSARVLASVSPPPTSAPPVSPAAGSPRRVWWQGLQINWTGTLGLAAMAVILAIALIPILRHTFQDDSPQVAMASIGDRSALFEPSDVRMRGPFPPPPSADQRFHDVEVPTALLRELVKAADLGAGADAVRALKPYLPAAGPGRPTEPHIVLDAALRQRIASATADRFPVRIYDLDDPRSADVRKLLGATADGRTLLLTLKP
jgi:hypothetical protein